MRELPRSRAALERGLAAAVYFYGRVDGAAEAQRVPALLAALYEDLGLAAREGAAGPEPAPVG